MQSLWIIFLFAANIKASMISMTQTTSKRGSLLPPKPSITTTIDVSQVTVVESYPETTIIPSTEPHSKSAVPSSPTSTDWSTELPPRWFPRRKFASSAESVSFGNSLSLLIWALMIICVYLL